MSSSTSLPSRISRAFRGNPGFFARENAAIAKMNLPERTSVTTTPFELGDALWLDFEAESGVALTIGNHRRTGDFTLELNSIGSARWLSLSYRLDMKTLRRGRYFALLTQTVSPGFLSFRPCIRYHRPDLPFFDHFSRDHMVSSGGTEENLCFIRIDHDLLTTASHTELHIFFDGTAFTAGLKTVENILIV